MNLRSNDQPESPLASPGAAVLAIPAGQRMYWLVRRELWENRAIYIAPLAVAALILVGFLISAAHLPQTMRAAMELDPMRQRELVEQPYTFAALLIMGTTFLVSIFYCLEALHGERRDRGILFWKSMPVSDVDTVLSKASIPLLLLPLLTFAITIATQVLMLLISAVALVGRGPGIAGLWANLPLFQMSAMLLFHLVAMHGLWYAPFYGWMLLVSSWARRAPFLWAVLPLLAIGVVEKIAFGTTHFAAMLAYRFGGDPDGGGFPADSMSMEPLTHLGIGRFLASPGLWVGLAVAAAFLAGAVWMRRNRGPI